MSQYTLLSISGIDIPDAAARGISVTLQPEENGQLVRDVNGGAVDLTIEGFQKYRASIACTDQDAPLFDGIFRGSGPFSVSLVKNLGVTNTTDDVLILSMYVDTWQTSSHEWSADVDWQIDLIEA